MIDIQSNAELASFCSEMDGQPYITIDTEFIRERTFYPILALIQVSWKNRVPVLIDPLRITNWDPFHYVLKDPAIRKVFHAGRQDVEIFFYQMGEVPENLFDTQIAASMCGFGDQVGYSALVSRILGTQLTKGSSFTNWLRRPLTDAQLSYAADDVLYLPAVYERLHKRAEEKGRLEWISDETLTQFDRKLFEPDLNQIWRKVKKSNSLSPKNLAVLQALARWRYETARELDKPLRFIISDEAMVELAKVDRLSHESLSARRGMQSKILDRYGDDIIDVHDEARALPSSEWPVTRSNRDRTPSDKSEALADFGWLLIKEIARGAHIAPTHLTSKKDLAFFIDACIQGGDLDEFAINRSWRLKMVGKPLMDLIEGRLVLQVKDHRIKWVSEDTEAE